MSAMLDVLQVAHDFGYPHQEPVPAPGGGGGASAIVIAAALALTLAALGALLWLKKRAG
jgi:formiminotetrahydrofolate cyclodeaminase